MSGNRLEDDWLCMEVYGDVLGCLATRGKFALRFYYGIYFYKGLWDIHNWLRIYLFTILLRHPVEIGDPSTPKQRCAM